jgi:carbamate kinase
VLIVVALGGNALLRRGEPLDVETQRHNIAAAAAVIAELSKDHQLVVTHGNGPQVGLLALQTAAYAGTAPYPLDVLDAESEGMIGYLLEQAIGNALPGRDVAMLLTQVVVAHDDPAFRSPTKPIGPVYTEAEGKRLAHDNDWTVAPDGAGWRRVVASPRPIDIVEFTTIETLLEADTVVVCVGGGGIPVTFDHDGSLQGVEAVIDKDASSALLASRLGADCLLLLTDVDGVSLDWGTPTARVVRRADPAALPTESFAAGSMGPKVAAACRFATETRGAAVIANLPDAAAALAGIRGTTITMDADGITYA